MANPVSVQSVAPSDLEVDRPPCSAELLESVCGTYMAWKLLKQGDNFTYVSSCLFTVSRLVYQGLYFVRDYLIFS